jgi:hypothetical protein
MNFFSELVTPLSECQLPWWGKIRFTSAALTAESNGVGIVGKGGMRENFLYSSLYCWSSTGCKKSKDDTHNGHCC